MAGKMKVLWLCGIPEEVRLKGAGRVISPIPSAAWSWILGHLPPPGGVELHIVCPVPGLTDREVHFKYLSTQWHCFRRKRFEMFFLWFRMLLEIKSLVKKLQPDVIHGWGGETGCGWLSTWLTPKAFVSVQGLLRLFDDVGAEHGVGLQVLNVRRFVMRFIEGETYRRANQLFVESETSGCALRKYYGLDGILLPHPLRSVFRGDVEKKIASENRIHILFVGQMDARKGPLDALRAFAAIGDAAVDLTMVGSGEQLYMAQEFVEQHELSELVIFRPVCSAADVCALMRSSHVYLLPSYGDTGPTSLKEALSQGCVAVCYNNTGPKELVERFGGFLARTGDVKDLARKLQDAIGFARGHPEAAEAVAKLVRRALSPEIVWASLISAYDGTGKITW